MERVSAPVHPIVIWRRIGDGTVDTMKRKDQIALLKTVLKFTDTGECDGIFTYPNCGPDLVAQGLATEDTKITDAGRATLWLLGEGPDPTESKSFKTFQFPLNKSAR